MRGKDALLADAAETAGEHLAAIQALFKPGVKVTLLVRTTTHPDGSRDFILTDDDLNEAIKAIRIRAASFPLPTGSAQ